MPNDKVVQLIQPGTCDDQLTTVLRDGAKALLAKTVEAKVAVFLAKHAGLKIEEGHQRIVRHGHLPEREVMTGLGPIAVHQLRVRDREVVADDPGRVRFAPSILPPYVRRSTSIETLLPILHLKGISVGDFSGTLAALLGKDASGLSPSAIGQLKDGWQDDHASWQKRDLSAKRYVYIWADGIHLQARMEDEKQCILVLIGATLEGKEELVGFNWISNHSRRAVRYGTCRDASGARGGERSARSARLLCLHAIQQSSRPCVAGAVQAPWRRLALSRHYAADASAADLCPTIFSAAGGVVPGAHTAVDPCTPRA